MNSKLVILLALFVAPLTLASGGSGGGSYGGSSAPQPRQVDEAYEYGKSLFSGRSNEVEKVKYCVAGTGEEESVPVKRSSLRPFKGKTFDELGASLYDCNNPEKVLLDYVNSSQAAHIIYYLNKRYKLKLTQ